MVSHGPIRTSSKTKAEPLASVAREEWYINYDFRRRRVDQEMYQARVVKISTNVHDGIKGIRLLRDRTPKLYMF